MDLQNNQERPDIYLKGYIYPQLAIRPDGKVTPLWWNAQPRHFIGAFHPFQDGQDVTELWELDPTDKDGRLARQATKVPQKERVGTVPRMQEIPPTPEKKSWPENGKTLSASYLANEVVAESKEKLFTYDDIREAVEFGMGNSQLGERFVFGSTDEYYQIIREFADGLLSTQDL